MKPNSSDEPLMCTQRKLYRGALGFLLTYVQLISYESDFNMAKGAWLLPKEVAWEHWLELVKQLIALEEPKDINKHYIYGELRLNRLNFIYRWAWWNVKDISPIRGYNYNYNQYSVFFRRNFAWVAAVFFYVTIVLTAMQVGLGTDRLKNDTRFQAASYGFTVFSILGPILAGGVAMFTFFLLFLHNLAATLAFEKKTFGKLKQDKYRV
ncbi:hypothetical protein B0A49_12416 [Cryomyces minteri]|uniref:Uncharacterized protein n=1 Tax=Cryomyces minteri TaxID=331657 RepID=A0A4U0WV50_9PEZI|nr:hypothetical protein B0A49_12416 [Cryomyces minteri]